MSYSINKSRVVGRQADQPRGANGRFLPRNFPQMDDPSIIDGIKDDHQEEEEVSICRVPNPFPLNAWGITSEVTLSNSIGKRQGKWEVDPEDLWRGQQVQQPTGKGLINSSPKKMKAMDMNKQGHQMSYCSESTSMSRRARVDADSGMSRQTKGTGDIQFPETNKTLSDNLFRQLEQGINHL